MDLCSVSQSDSRYNRKGASGDGWSYGASGLRWRCRSLRQHDAIEKTSFQHDMAHQMMCISSRMLQLCSLEPAWQAPNGDFDNLYLDMNGSLAEWISMTEPVTYGQTLRHHSPMLPPWRWSCTCGWGTHVSWYSFQPPRVDGLMARLVDPLSTDDMSFWTTEVWEHFSLFRSTLPNHQAFFYCCIFFLMEAHWNFITEMHETIPKTIKIPTFLWTRARPKRLVYMAIDGVAPRIFLRIFQQLHFVTSKTQAICGGILLFAPYFWLKGAKMNQQRARRFRAAQVEGFDMVKWWNVEDQLSGAGRDGARTRKASTGLGGDRVQWIWNILKYMNIWLPFLGESTNSWIWVTGFWSEPFFSIHPTGIHRGGRANLAQSIFRKGLWFERLAAQHLETPGMEKPAPFRDLRWSLREPISCTRCRRQEVFNKRCLKFYHRI